MVSARFRALLGVAFLLRWCIALHPHSGYGVEPMHGDFEAQRHWVEITSHLPRLDWYRNTTDNDLQYWGLDYPPLSAYHARLIAVSIEGFLGRFFFSDTVAVLKTTFGLFTSRGAEDMSTIVIMRISSLVTDALIFAPAAVCIAKQRLTMPEMGIDDDLLVSLFFLFAPLPQLFIDHGHFQFNSVPAGLILWVVYLLSQSVAEKEQQQQPTSDKKKKPQENDDADEEEPSLSSSPSSLSPLFCDCLAAFLSGSAVMFKQMSIYYCPGIAVVLLVRCCAPMWWPPQQHQRPRQSPIAAVILRLIATLFAGLCGLLGPMAPLSPADVLARMFPFQRGLYEDKVANVWCALSPALKLPRLLGDNRDRVLVVCLASTVLSFLPAAIVFCVSVARTAKLAKLERSSSSSSSRPVSAIQTRGKMTSQELAEYSADNLEYRSYKGITAEDAVSVARVATLLTVSALSFFLFAFQVHEKSILMAVATTAVIWVAQDSRQPRGPLLRLACAHFLLVAMISLQPLAVKDQLDGAVWCTLTALCAIASATAFTSPALASAGNAGEHAPEPGNVTAMYLLSGLSLALCSVVMPLLVEPSAALPDIVPMANSIVCCAHFVWYLVFWTRQLEQLF